MEQSERTDTFVNEPSELMKILNEYRKAAALISPELMVLRQTERCEALLQSGGFYPLESWLDARLCRRLRDCIARGESGLFFADILDARFQVRLMLLETNAVLIFEPEEGRIPAMLYTAARMRERANALLMTAQRIEKLPGGEVCAAEVRRDALRMLRGASHAELLADGSPQMNLTACDLSDMLNKAKEKLEQNGIPVEVEYSGSLLLNADENLLQAALMTLVSNSIRYGGEGGTIRLSARRRGEEYLIDIKDCGSGLSARAVQMSEHWRDPDADLLDSEWGLGLPFAQRVARLHGGRLSYIYSESGSSVCLSVRSAGEDRIRAGLLYASDSIDPMDIELSAVLGAQAFLRKE